jgi:hypothetical protein
MATRQERLEQNQREFRYANERLDELAGRLAVDGQLVAFLCECADDDCLGRIEITIGRYEEIHVERDRYVVLPGHPRIAGEETVEDRDYYEVVRKPVVL